MQRFFSIIGCVHLSKCLHLLNSANVLYLIFAHLLFEIIQVPSLTELDVIVSGMFALQSLLYSCNRFVPQQESSFSFLLVATNPSPHRSGPTISIDLKEAGAFSSKNLGVTMMSNGMRSSKYKSVSNKRRFRAIN